MIPLETGHELGERDRLGNDSANLFVLQALVFSPGKLDDVDLLVFRFGEVVGMVLPAGIDPQATGTAHFRDGARVVLSLRHQSPPVLPEYGIPGWYRPESYAPTWSRRPSTHRHDCLQG